MVLNAADTFYKLARQQYQKAKNRGIPKTDYAVVVNDIGHFPINLEHEAKKAIANIKGLTKSPKWWTEENGTLAELKSVVVSKVKHKFPDLDIDKIKPKTPK